MAKDEVVVCKVFSFDSSHQLIGHCGKCANVHGHTYKLEVKLKGAPKIARWTSQDVQDGIIGPNDHMMERSDEGFVMDFYELKTTVNELIVDRLDHAFIARGDEPILPVLESSGVKVVRLGFRTTVENMSKFICWRLLKAGLPIHSIRMWETPTGWAETYAEDVDVNSQPIYNTAGTCDLD